MTALLIPSLLALFLPCSSPAPVQGPPARIALLLGPPGGPGDVVLVEESGLAPPQPVAGLAGIRLLALDAAGRSPWSALLADAPRVRTDVAGAARILLPAEQGSLYRYRREAPGGPAFGFFRVDAQNGAAVLLELAGAGPTGDQDPFLERVGVDAAGGGILVATTPAAGGDLFEIDLAAGTASNRTPSLGPLLFSPAGGRLLATFGVAVALEGIARFDRASGAAAELVAIPGIAPPSYWDGGIAVSADGSTAATVAGSAPEAAHVIVLGAGGDAHPLDSTPQHLSGSGFLPDSSGGPYLALSADGSLAAWRTVVATGVASREAWLGRTAPLPGATPEHVTADAHFVDTLDESGLIGFVSATTALLAVGELADPAVPGSTDIDGMDLYLATLNPDGTTAIANASLTSGDALEPFTKGSLGTEDGVHLLDGAQALVFDKGQGELGRVVLGIPGVQPILSLTKELRRVERAGSRLLVEARHETAAAGLKVYALDPSSGAAALLGSLPDGASLSRHAARADGRVAFAIGFLGKEWIARGDLVALSGGLASALPLVYGPALGLSATGSLALTVGAPAGPAYAVVWTALGGVALLPVPLAPAQVLPGAS